MNHPEKELRQDLLRALGNLWLCQQHEDRNAPNIPDLSYSARGVNGWIELKTGKANSRGHIDLRHLTAGQCTWLLAHWDHAPYTWLFLRILPPKPNMPALHCLVPGNETLGLYGMVPLSTILHVTRGTWAQNVEWGKLLDLLTGREPRPRTSLPGERAVDPV